MKYIYAKLNKIMAYLHYVHVCSMYNMNFHDTYIHMYNASLVEKYIQFITRSVNREDDKIGKY